MVCATTNCHVCFTSAWGVDMGSHGTLASVYFVPRFFWTKPHLSLYALPRIVMKVGDDLLVLLIIRQIVRNSCLPINYNQGY